MSLTISSQTPPDSLKIRGRDIPSRLEQEQRRLPVYSAHLALNWGTYKYYHPRTNLNLAGGGLKTKRKNGLNCDSGSSPVYFLSLPTGLFILSSVLQKKKEKIQNRTIIVPCHTSDECFLFSAHPKMNQPHTESMNCYHVNIALF